MWKSLLLILMLGFASAYYTDLSSDSTFYAVFLPLIDALALLALVIWIVLFLHARGGRLRRPYDSSGGDSPFNGSGGDGGD